MKREAVAGVLGLLGIGVSGFGCTDRTLGAGDGGPASGESGSDGEGGDDDRPDGDPDDGDGGDGPDTTDEPDDDVRFDLPPQLDSPADPNPIPPRTSCGLPGWSSTCTPDEIGGHNYLDVVCVALPPGRIACDECEPDCLEESGLGRYYDTEDYPEQCVCVDDWAIEEIHCGPNLNDVGECCYVVEYEDDGALCVCLAPPGVFPSPERDPELVAPRTRVPSRAEVLEQLVDKLPADVLRRLRR